MALVSGGASGIGRASALRMASEGAIVVVADLPMQEAAAHQVIGELNAENQNGKHQFITLDVTVEDQWAAAIKVIR